MDPTARNLARQTQASRIDPPAGLQATYLALRGELIRFLRARGAGDGAEDLVQELWLKISRATTSPVSDPASYLFRAANNLMISQHRSTARGERRDFEWGTSDPDPMEPGIEEAISAREEITLAEQRLRELGQRVLRVFILFRIDGMPQRDIANDLGLSLSAVEKDLQRAYAAIAGLREDTNADIPAARRLKAG